MKLNTKIYLTLFLSGILMLALIRFSMIQQEYTMEQLEELNRHSRMLQEDMALSTRIEELKRHVLNFTLTGDTDSINAAESLAAIVQKNIQQLDTTAAGELQKTLSRLKLHLDNYMGNFAIMKLQRPIHNELRNALHTTAAAIETEINTAQSTKNGADAQMHDLRLLNNIMKVEQGITRYFETLDRTYAEAALAALENTQLLARSRSVTSETLETNLDHFHTIVDKSLQHFRAYLMLDVVMNGEAHEMLYYAKELRIKATKAFDVLREDLSHNAEKLRTILIVTAILFLLMMFASSWILIKIITTPLREMTQTFEALTASQQDVTIPENVADDDIGKLTRAAKAFEEKNLKIRQLLDESRKLGEQLSLSEHRLRVASESGQVGVWDLNLVTQNLEWDDTLFSLYGVQRSDFDSTYDAWARCVYPKDVARVADEITSAITNHRRFDSKFHIIRQDSGEVRTIKSYADILYDSEDKAVRMIGINYDITESETLTHHLEERVAEESAKRHEQEQLLIQQSKLAAMGEMISAIAHQWRQPLNAIALYLQDMLSAKRNGELDDAYFKESISLSMKQVNHLSQTIEDFRSFFRPSSGDQDFNVAQALQDAVTLFSAQLQNNDIEVDMTQISGNTLLIYGNSNHLRQVFLNLMSNAIDAIKERSEVENTHNGKITLQLFDDRETLRIKIVDNGIGLKNEIQSRLFEPYYTTKEQGKGSGIGLYMSRTIIQNYFHGALALEPRTQGCAAVITIPKRVMEASDEA